MKISFPHYVACTLWFVINLNLSNGLVCVSCSECSEPYNSSFDLNITCPKSLNTCFKVYYKEGNYVMVSKGCILSSACASITIRSNSYSGGLGCCSYDLCNRSSVGTTPSLLSILLLPFACLVHISWMFPNVP